MYSQGAFKGGYGHKEDGHQAIDTSHFLTIPRANTLYVNEVGDDSKRGTLDMQSHKIVNLADPTHSKDATNKGFVDKTIDPLNKNMWALVKEVEKLAVHLPDTEKHKTDLYALTVEAGKLQKGVEEMKITVHKQMTTLYDTLHKVRETQTLAFKQLQESVAKVPLFYPFYLIIGSNGYESGTGKVTVYEIVFPYPLENNRMNLQITVVHDSIKWLDDIVSVIKKYTVVSNTLRLEVYTFRSTYNISYWGLNVMAHLLVTVFPSAIAPIINMEKHQITSGFISIPLPK